MIPLIAPELEQYAAAHSTAPSEIVQQIGRKTDADCEDPQMMVGPLQASLLKMLVQLVSARRVLEIGMFTGYSALSMAEALPADGRIICCDRNPETTELARSFFDRSPHGAKIQVALGDALDTISTLDGPFDLVFIDADKEQYLELYEAVVPKVRAGGLIVADNVLWSGAVLNPKHESDRILVQFNSRINDDNRVDNVLLTVRDGIMVARRR